MPYRFIPLTILIIGFIAFYYFDLHHYLNINTLKQHYQSLIQWKSEYPLMGIIIFMLIYIVMAACSIPGAAIMTITGGFLFGIWIGAAAVVVSATGGASLIFLAARTALGEFLAEKAGPRIKNLEHGFHENAFNYLLVLRLIPLFPFWLVNIVPALLNVKLSTFIIATFIGIIPGSIVYVSIGNGLDTLLAAGKTPNLSIIFSLPILLPILGLALLSILPVIYKKFKRKT